MNITNKTWDKLRRKKYREAFVFQAFKRMIPFQISAMRKARGWSQDRLAREAEVTQGVISRAEDPDYGSLTVKTICRIAAGFDVAFIGKFVPFSELDGWFNNLSDSGIVLSFTKEDALQVVVPFEKSSGFLKQACGSSDETPNLFGETPAPPMKAETWNNQQMGAGRS